MKRQAQQQTTIPLTDQQQRIVSHNQGAALVYAVAGSGKTTAMLHRVERLVREQVFPAQRILLSSFNKAAVEQLGERMAAWPHCRPVVRQTLHALGYRIIRDAVDLRLYPPFGEESVKDIAGVSRRLLWQSRDVARRENRIDSSELESLDEDDFLTYIGAMKGSLRYADLAKTALPAAARRMARQADPPHGLPWYLELYRIYEQLRTTQQLITFDDMLSLSWELLVRHERLLQRWQQRFDAVIVDEFQDVNPAQAELLDLLVQPHGNLMAIGDDDQTIYTFRGADPAIFHGFQRRYAAVVYEMTDNFRCYAGPVVLAGRVVGQNRNRRAKQPIAARGFGGQHELHIAPDETAMVKRAVQDIRRALDDGFQPDQIVVLVRLTAQTAVFEQAFSAAEIPHQVLDAQPFYQRREVADLLRYCDLAQLDAQLRAGQPADEQQMTQISHDWRQVYNRPKRYLTRQFADEVVQSLRRGRSLSAALWEHGQRLPRRTADSVERLVDVLHWLAEQPDGTAAADLLSGLERRLGYCDFLLEGSSSAETGRSAAANVTQLLTLAQGKGSYRQFRRYLVELAESQRALSSSGAAAVSLRTIHSAKGLEWPVVLIPHCNPGYIPAERAEDLDEERRLLYVAITRSQQRLHLYASGKAEQLTPLLRDVRAERIMADVQVTEQLLRKAAAQLTADEALKLLCYPRVYGQQRFFTHWWRLSGEQRTALACRLVGLADLLEERHALSTAGAAPGDRAFWQQHCADRPADRAPFVGLEAFTAKRSVIAAHGTASAARTAAARSPGAAPSKRSPTPQLPVGQRVRHASYGSGTIRALEQRDLEGQVLWCARIAFDNGESKLIFTDRLVPITQ
jgi:DNA helicase II / ATP-dependent DNA helicase PcrA